MSFRIAGRSLLLILLFCFFPGCSPDKVPLPENHSPHFIATIPPLAAILDEIVGDRGQVSSLLLPGASPHTYEPKPSDLIALENAVALFYVDDYLDGWAASLGEVEKIDVFRMVPENRWIEMIPHTHGDAVGQEHRSGGYDTHFWTSPVVVKAILPDLVDELVRLDPEGERIYRNNAVEFGQVLDELHLEIRRLLEPYRGKALLMFHPSMEYFLTEYGLWTAGYIEEYPGREPTARYITHLIMLAEINDARAILTEPQLPIEPAETLAEETGLPIFTIDPLGGSEGRETYVELMLYNTTVLVEALGE